MKQIGILSGTFDPIHSGHTTLAQAALKQLKLDELWVLVNGYPEHKTDVATFEHRLEMARRAVTGLQGVVADREPIQLQRHRHSIATARQLVHDYPRSRFTLVMGIDTFCGIDRWEASAELLSLVSFAVAERPGSDSAAIADLQQRLGGAASSLNYQSIDMPLLPVSSQLAKHSLRAGIVAAGVPAIVQDYISRHRLYTTPEGMR
jgi:nicotinate-nucleotide adenylyltransferase